MASADEEGDLRCGLCLETYKNPKFLPCHHTFCEDCLVSLVKNTGSNSLKCPKCRQQVQLPQSGVSQLQTNFYITPMLNPERCQLHRSGEKLTFYCVQCNTAICLNCKLADHDKHEVQDLDEAVEAARSELKNCRSRLGESKVILDTQLIGVQERIFFSGETREALKRVIDKRIEQITLMAKTCGEDIVQELESSFQNLHVFLQEDKGCVEKRMSTVQGLQQEVTQALDGGTNHILLTLMSEMRDGRGSQQQQQKLTSALLPNTDHPTLRYDDNCLQRDVIRDFLGRMVQFQSKPIHQSMTIRGVFRCCQDTHVYIHAVCAENCHRDNRVYVTYGTSGTEGEGWIAMYEQDGTFCSKSLGAFNGRVCLVGLNEGYVRVEGKDFRARDWISGTHSFGGNKQAKRKYDVYNKGTARFVLRVHMSGHCDLRSVTIGICTSTADSKVCDVNTKTPVAMDVSKDGQLLAVLEDGQDRVVLYRHGNTQPYACYKGNLAAMRPLDVCFYFIGGEERLVVADWLNDVLHVLDVSEHCKLIGHVGGESPLLMKPTALCPDRKGRLWIGCQGGHVFTLSQQ